MTISAGFPTFPSGFHCRTWWLNPVAWRRLRSSCAMGSTKVQIFSPQGKCLVWNINNYLWNFYEYLDSIQQDPDIFTICPNLRNHPLLQFCTRPPTEECCFPMSWKRRPSVRPGTNSLQTRWSSPWRSIALWKHVPRWQWVRNRLFASISSY